MKRASSNPSMRRRAAAIALAASVAFPASAAVVVQASATAFDVYTSYADVKNGALVAGGNYAAPGGSTTAAPLGAGGTQAMAGATEYAVAGWSAAELAPATGKAHGDSSGSSATPSTIAFARSTWTEGVTFNNTSGAVAELALLFTTVGSVFDPNGPGWGSESLTSSIELRNSSLNATNVLLKNTPSLVPGGAQFSLVNGIQSFGFQPNGVNYGEWTTSFLGDTGGAIGATLLVPVGVSTIDIITFLQLDCRGASVCDYGHTSSFSFGVLPAGLSWTSESGVFLSATTGGGPGAVPEPSTLALLGIALAALPLRRRPPCASGGPALPAL